MDKGTAVEKIVESVGVPMSELKHHIQNLAKKGIGHDVVAGVVTAVYPAGRGVEDFFVQRGE
jgi:hypothetical protein